jgi:DNA mismatch endonuclease (patch repair protein)
MADIVDVATRSRMMSAIRGKNTQPELALRRGLWAMGFRFRIHNRKVPGAPDISHSGLKLAVFVDGCFWHKCPQHYRRPGSRQDFWDRKIENNLRRRESVKATLAGKGWKVIEVWEHQLRREPVETVRLVAVQWKRRARSVAHH